MDLFVGVKLCAHKACVRLHGYTHAEQTLRIWLPRLMLPYGCLSGVERGGLGGARQ